MTDRLPAEDSTVTVTDADTSVEPVRRALALRPLIARLPGLAAWSVLALATLWVLFLANGTSAGPAVKDPAKFLVTLLDGLTFAGLMFVVASGFTLIFGLMRTVNMAHGSLFLLAGVHRHRAAADDGRQDPQHRARRRRHCCRGSCRCSSAPAVAAVLGVVIQQVFLRWNQGQDLRQALITVAISVILADQMLRQFGGLAQR